MKKPTFSKIVLWILFLFENFCQKNFSFYASFAKKFRNLKNGLFQKSYFSTMQSSIAVLLFLLFLTTTLSSFSNIEKSSLLEVTVKGINVKEDTTIVYVDSLKNKIANSKGEAALLHATVAITNPVIKYAQLPYAV